MVMESLIGQELGEYRVETMVGKGGMGAVYKAWDIQMKQPVAIKVFPLKMSLPPEDYRRFEREININLTLGRHPYIVPFYDYGMDDDYIYVVMRFFKDGSLRDYVQNYQLTISQIMTWFSQIASALDYAHSFSIIHRDVKLGNVLLDLADNHAYLSDFGIAKMEDATQLTRTGSIGTARYMAPERVLQNEVDHRVDVYAMGILLFRLLTGRFPYTDNVDVAIVQKHLHAPIPKVTDFNPALPGSLNAVFFKALAKDPVNRYSSCQSLADAFKTIVERHQLQDSFLVALDGSTILSEEDKPDTKIISAADMASFLKSNNPTQLNTANPQMPAASQSLRSYWLTGGAVLGIILITLILLLFLT